MKKSSSLDILLLCYEYPPIGGGGGVGAQKYAEAWVRAGHRVTVLTSRAAGLEKREVVAGVDVVRVPTFGKKHRATATNLSMLCYLVFGFLHVLWRLRAYRRFDVMNTHFSIPTGPLGWVASRMLGVPNVLTIIGGDIYDPTKSSSPHRSALLRFANRVIINGASRVVAISSDTRTRAKTHYDIRVPIGVINYGFEPFDLEPANRADLDLDEDAFYLVATGRLVERKGFDHLIRAMASVPDDVRLLIVGDGPLDETLRACARDAGVEERVTFLGFRPRSEVLAYLQVANCFVLSSIHEGLGIVVQEAMYAGQPVIATDNGGQVDLIVEGRNGRLVPIEDSDALAAAIRELHGDRELAAAMAANNRADLERCYMTENCQQYVTLFDELAGTSRTREVTHSG